MEKPIFISLSSNVEYDDLKLAKSLLFFPKRFRNKDTVSILEDNIGEITGIPYCFALNSGRSAFWVVLKSLDYPIDSEIIVPGFTCNALINPILNLSLRPVYVDIDKQTLNLNLDDLKQKITPKTKAIIIQHTFGLPDNIDLILEICNQRNVDLIEDCAHSLGAKINGKSVGSFGRAAFFSFGRDKIISSIFGGIAATKEDTLAEKISNIKKDLPECSSWWVKQQILHPILTEYKIKPLYNFLEIGKYFLILLQKANILSKAVSKKDKIGEFDINFVRKMPNLLAIMALHQLEKLQKFNNHRNGITNIYYQELKDADLILPVQKDGRIFMRYSILAKDLKTDKILHSFRQHKIFLDDGWRKANIVPPDTNQEKLGYIKGTCPNAEYVAEHILNLPTGINISAEDAKNIIAVLRGQI